MEEVDNPPASSCQAPLPAGDPQTPETTGLRREKEGRWVTVVTSSWQTDTSWAPPDTVQWVKNSSIMIHRDVLLEGRRSCSEQALDNLAFHSQQIWSEYILRKAHKDRFTYVDLIVCQRVTDDVELECAQRLRELLNSNRVAWNETILVDDLFIHQNTWV